MFANPDRRDQAQQDVRPAVRLRFVTTVDLPPFGFVRDGRITGFHVDLARAICEAAKLAESCSIQSLRFEEVAGALMLGSVDVALAGHQITPENRERFAFGDAYFRWPQRFLVKRASPLAEPMSAGLIDQTIGVMRGSVADAFVRAYFPDSRVAVFDDEALLFRAVDDGRIAAAFGDGVRFGFLAQPGAAAACCRLAGGPYFSDVSPAAMAPMMDKGRRDVQGTVNAAMRDLQRSGKLEELYLRWFPFDVFESRRKPDQG